MKIITLQLFLQNKKIFIHHSSPLLQHVHINHLNKSPTFGCCTSCCAASALLGEFEEDKEPETTGLGEGDILKFAACKHRTTFCSTAGQKIPSPITCAGEVCTGVEVCGGWGDILESRAGFLTPSPDVLLLKWPERRSRFSRSTAACWSFSSLMTERSSSFWVSRDERESISWKMR